MRLNTSLLALALLTMSCTAEHVSETEQAQLPVDPEVQEIAFGGLLRLVATSYGLPPGSVYRPATEYWTGSTAIPLSSLSSLSMTTARVAYPADAQITGFLSPSSSFGAPLTTAQIVGTSGWTRGTYTPPTAAKLFKATDPDDGAHHIGLLVMQGSGNALAGIVWYKTRDTGTIFASTPASLAFTAVLDASGNSSLNPADIEPSAAWFYHAGP
jgi:hypothetical protein